MKVAQALCRSRPYLNDGDKDKAETRLVCEVLLRHIMGLSRTELYASMEREITAAQEASWAALINRYVAGEPVAYILGEREFYGRNFIVAPGVLIPRPETELLVEKVCSLVGDSYGVIADIGTGSGAIAISLAMEIGHSCVWATDIRHRSKNSRGKLPPL
jgi:release factor glutamine methyltransferase